MDDSPRSSPAGGAALAMPTARDAALFLPLGLGCVLILCGWVLGLPWGTLGGFDKGAPTSPTPVLAVVLVVVASFFQLSRWTQVAAAVTLVSLARDLYLTATTEIPSGVEAFFGKPHLGAGLVVAAVGGLLVIAALIADVATRRAPEPVVPEP